MEERFILETERLILRNYKESDIDDYFEYISSPDVGPRICFDAYTDKTTALERLKLETAKPYQFAIVLKSENKVIGSVDLNDTKNNERYQTIDKKLMAKAKNVGFLLSPKYWGQGIMPEAVHAAVKFAFDILNLNALVCSHAEANKQSGRVQYKLGFKKVNVVPNYRIWIDGKYTSSIERLMTKDDYLNNPDLCNFKVKISKL